MSNNSAPKYTIKPLFDFQALCDTDIGLYRLIKKEYYDKSIFKSEMFEGANERFIKVSLLTRKYFNPLFIFCKDDVMKNEELDDLYQQFLDEEYDKILSLSIPTSIFSIASMSNSTNNLVDVTVLCKSQKEINWIHKYSPKINCILSEYKNFDTKQYDTLYIKDLYTLLEFKQDTIRGKNILFSKFLFNIESEYTKIDMPIIEVTKKYYKDNKFMMIEPYKDLVIPMTEPEEVNIKNI